MKSRSLKIVLGVVAAVFVLCVLAFSWMKFAPRRVPAGQPPLSSLDAGSLPAFRDAFNASGGDVGVLAMLAPT